MMKKIIILAVLLVAAAIWLMSKEKGDSDTFTVYGNVDIRQVDISFQVPGVIKEMRFEEGESVSKSDLLAALDDKDFRANYDKATAETKRLLAASQNAESIYQRQIELCLEGVTSQQQCTSYTNAKNEAFAAYESAVASQQLAGNQLEDTRVYAPDDGIITSRIQEPGATVQAGQLIYTIAKSKPLWIRAYVSETNLGYIKYGTPARVITDSKDKTTGKKREYEGRIGYISPVAEFTPKTVQTEDLRTDLVYRINVYVDEADGFLKQGMPATVKINKN